MKLRHLILFVIFFVFLAVGHRIGPKASACVRVAGVCNNLRQPVKPPMYVLQVGVSKYLNSESWGALDGAVNDIEGMKKVLVGERFGIPSQNIRTLIDEKATKKAIFDEFEKHLIGKARDHFKKTKERNAVILFQFSGHGSQVKDLNGDEADKLDETLVPYDSRDEPGKNFDITDDEIFRLTQQLSQFTDNIIYILDSCHSGTGTRDAGNSRRLPPRKTTPVPLLEAMTRGDGVKKARDGKQTDLLPVSDDYIVISATKAETLAGQKYFFKDENSREPEVFGYLTFFLIQELRNAKHNTTYRELIDNVTREVANEKPSQIPQLEGDEKRFVFDGLGRREDNFIRIEKVTKIRGDDPPGYEILVKAGAMQGMTAGTILGIYDADETEFAGKERVASAKVVQVAADKSRAEITWSKQVITKREKVVIISRDFGSNRVKVLLNADETKFNEAEKTEILEKLQAKFAGKRQGQPGRYGIELIEGRWDDQKTHWDIALLKDNFRRAFPNRQEKNDPLASDEVFYLAGREFVPLYGFFVPTTDPAQASGKIEQALLQLFRLRIVRGIKNDKSPLHGKIAVTPYRFTVSKNKKHQCDNNKIVTKKKSVPAFNKAKTAYEFDQQEYYMLEIENRSNSNVYINLLNVATDGSVKIIFPRKNDGEKDGFILPSGGKKILNDSCSWVLKTEGPPGLETLKLIATVDKSTRRDFEFLEMKGIAKRGKKTSISDFGEWTTVDINFEISSVQKN